MARQKPNLDRDEIEDLVLLQLSGLQGQGGSGLFQVESWTSIQSFGGPQCSWS